MPLVPIGSNYYGGESDYPLLQACVHYELVDVYLSARVTQTFKSKAHVPTEVKYVFPLPPDSSVHAFEAVINRTRVIKGVAKEKEQAKREYERAKRQGRTAALLDQKTEEVFEMSLGNIQPKSTIDVHISLFSVVEQDGTPDTLRLRFPTTIAPRYGYAPINASGTTPPVVKLTLSVTSSAPIQSIKSTSHPIETLMGRTTEFDTAEFDPMQARVTLSSKKFLEADVVVVIRCKGLDRPRCTAELFLPEEGAEEPTEAYALTIVPRFESAIIPCQEYIFLVDRSGSMHGHKMDAVRSALRIVLASLPTSKTAFNIVSFGSHYDSLWSSSRDYNTETVKEAMQHVDDMIADYGGTEISRAISGAVGLHTLEVDRPTAIFLLTDGEAWDLDGVSIRVRQHMDEASLTSSPLKFFCMGIGNTPSKALVDTIARAGNGVSLFVQEDEDASAKLITLLRAARSEPVQNLQVDWGIGTSSPSATLELEEDFELIPRITEKAPLNIPTARPISLYDESTAASEGNEQLGPSPPPPVVLAPPPRLQQAPSLQSLPPLYSGFRFSVFAIVRRDGNSEEKPNRPRCVRITGMVGDQLVTQELPVHIHSPSTHSGTSTKFLHVLAARAMIRSFEDRAPMSAKDKAEILRLAVRYGLSSSQTSFIAAEDIVPDTIGSESPIISDVPDADPVPVAAETYGRERTVYLSEPESSHTASCLPR